MRAVRRDRNVLLYDITFVGRVQGVGFRWTTRRVAERFEVAGWVRNEPDGTVRCVAQGEVSELDTFVQAVQEAMAGNITDTRTSQRAGRSDLDGFTIQ
jgi:acylphosphatase